MKAQDFLFIQWVEDTPLKVPCDNSSQVEFVEGVFHQAMWVEV